MWVSLPKHTASSTVTTTNNNNNNNNNNTNNKNNNNNFALPLLLLFHRLSLTFAIPLPFLTFHCLSTALPLISPLFMHCHCRSLTCHCATYSPRPQARTAGPAVQRSSGRRSPSAPRSTAGYGTYAGDPVHWPRPGWSRVFR